MQLFERLKAACSDDWEAYIDHEFVRQLGAGTLPQSAFRRYLIQDYLFLIQFARAWGLVAYKARSLAGLNAARNGLSHIVNETELHVRLCARWGVSRQELDNHEEYMQTIAYTRFVLDRGACGDLLDLMVALSPCVVGYGEIGKRLAPNGVESLGADHPYREWIGEYASDSYQSVAKDAAQYINELALTHFSEGRFEELAGIFRKATRLEENFWSMGLDENAC